MKINRGLSPIIANELADLVLSKLIAQCLQAKTITIKVKYANFQQVTRAQTVDMPLDSASVKEWIPQLLKRTAAGEHPIRLVGLSLSGLEKVNPDSKGVGQLALIH